MYFFLNHSVYCRETCDGGGKGSCNTRLKRLRYGERGSCDAGSEKTKTDVATTHGQMVESNNINRSLLVLGTTKNKTLASLGIALSARPTGFLQFFDTVGLVI